MNSKELLKQMNKDFKALKHKGYDRKSFFAGYLIAYFKQRLSKAH